MQLAEADTNNQPAPVNRNVKKNPGTLNASRNAGSSRSTGLMPEQCELAGNLDFLERQATELRGIETNRLPGALRGRCVTLCLK
jgi:hypothetical protein